MRRSVVRLLPPILVAPLALALAGEASANPQLRYSTTTSGGVTATGNTLGLSKELSANGPGVEDSIGTFLTLDAGLTDTFPANASNPWGAGTTNDWALNGSTADLDLPVEVEVLYAELVWGGSTAYGSEDVTANLDTPVTLSFGMASTSVTPDSGTAETISQAAGGGSFTANYYMRSADVTSFVRTHGAGTYAVEGVPATQDTQINSLNAGGWTLIVVHRGGGAPVRNLSVFVGGSFVDEQSQVDYPIAGFCAPPSGAVEGVAVISAIEGDADLTGDTLSIAPTASGPFANLSGPNNPVTNFFASQINDSTGALDTRGSSGTTNHNAMTGVNVSAGRQGWDVTKVSLSSSQNQLQVGQTSAVLRTTTTGDSYYPTVAALEIDVNSPDFQSGGSSIGLSPTVATIGDTAVLSVRLQNQGEADATALSFALDLPAGLSLVDFAIDGTSGDATGGTVDAAGLSSGASVGDIPVNTAKEIAVTVRVDAAPAGIATNFLLLPRVAYDFVTCVGQNAESDSYPMPAQFLDYMDPEGGTTTGGDDTTGDGGTADDGADATDSADAGMDDGADGGTAGDSDDGGTGASASGTDTGMGDSESATAGDDSFTGGFSSSGGASSGRGEDSGCNCDVGRPARPSDALFFGLGLMGLLGLRRRRD